MASQFNMATKYGKLQLEPYSGASTKVADRGMGQVKKVSCNLTDKEIHLFFFMKIANNLGYNTLFLGSEIL